MFHDFGIIYGLSGIFSKVNPLMTLAITASFFIMEIMKQITQILTVWK